MYKKTLYDFMNESDKEMIKAALQFHLEEFQRQHSSYGQYLV